MRTKGTENGLVLTMPGARRGGKPESAKEISNTLDWPSRPIRPWRIEFGWLSSTFQPGHFGRPFRISLLRPYAGSSIPGSNVNVSTNVLRNYARKEQESHGGGAPRGACIVGEEFLSKKSTHTNFDWINGGKRLKEKKKKKNTSRRHLYYKTLKIRKM